MLKKLAEPYCIAVVMPLVSSTSPHWCKFNNLKLYCIAAPAAVVAVAAALI